jgi:sugar phosphate isomerase/epimerase
MNYGLQLYSVRDVTKVDFESALRQVAEMGYTMVESAGFFGHSAEEVKAMLDNYGLTLCSTHTGCDLLYNDLEKTIDFHKKVGCKHIILPGTPFETKADIDYSVENINRCQAVIEAAGMKLHYHNHSGEFLPNKDGLIAEDEFAKRTNVLFELDTFWVYNAGVDPIALMEQYCDRLEFIHLKDGIAKADSEDGKVHGRSVGSGTAPVIAVRKKAIEMGLNIVIESEGLKPTGPEEVKRCIDFLRELDREEGR